MIEVWLRPNRRAIAAASCIPLATMLVGLIIAWQGARGSAVLWAYVMGGFLVALGALLLALLIVHWRQPRIGYRLGKVLFFLRTGAPIAIPIDLVEAFFVGQGPAMLSTRHGKKLEAINLIARISRRADQWQEVSVNPRLGHWCDGYATIRGTWCEPLTAERVLQLNQRLHDAQTTPRSEQPRK